MENIDELVEETKQRSFVLIEFMGAGLAEFRIYKQNVSPAQVLGALSVLELQVKNWFIQEENRRQEDEMKSQLSQPKKEILRP